MAVREPRPLREHRVAKGLGLGVLLGLDQLRQPLVQAEETDQVLGVLLAAIEDDFAAAPSAVQVPQRLQPLARLRVEDGGLGVPAARLARMAFNPPLIAAARAGSFSMRSFVSPGSRRRS